MTNPHPPHQFYVAHAPSANGAANGVGLGIRAASTRDPQLLRQALSWPKYELPSGLAGTRPTSAEAPRRLARLRTDPQSVWVLHSAHVEIDGMGREGSSFCHAVRLPAIDPATVLKTWAGPGWALDYPLDEDQSIPATVELEPGSLIHDAAITRFLTQPILGSPALGTVICPTRLMPAAARRREILLEFLAGILLSQEQSRHLVVHAEPGLVALLLYAAVRLLPAEVAWDLTFSTYEPAHRFSSLVPNATVIGTYFGNGTQGLEPDLSRVRAYGLDTFYPDRSSPELAAKAEELQEYLDRALAGRWLGEVEPEESQEPEDTGDAFLRVESGFGSPDDFQMLGGYPEGMEALLGRSEIVWPQLRCLAPVYPELIPTFAEWFQDPERLQPYFRAAFEAVADEDLAAWKKYWGVVAQSQSPENRAEYFLGLLRNRRRDLQTLTRPGRKTLRHEAMQCLAEATPEVVPLLYPCDVIECDEILNDELLPAKWRAFSLAATLKTSKTRLIHREIYQKARDFLPTAPPEVLREYILRAQHILTEHPELWNAVVDSPVDRGELLDRLLELGTIIPGAHWKEMLESLDMFAADSVLTPDRLSRLLPSVGVEPDGLPVWQAAISRLDLRFLKGDFSQAAEWAAVEKARQRATRARKHEPEKPFPPELTARLEAGLTLQRWMVETESTEPTASLHAALAILKCPLPAALKAIFHSALGAPSVGREIEKVDRFAKMFLMLYPVEANPQAAIAAWQTIAGTVPVPQRESLLGYFWTRVMPASKREAPLPDAPPVIAKLAPPKRNWVFEALLYSGIIAVVFALIAALLLIW